MVAEAVRERCAALGRWLGEVAAQVPREHECRIADSAELYQVKARFQALKERCDARTADFRAVNEAGEHFSFLVEKVVVLFKFEKNIPSKSSKL